MNQVYFYAAEPLPRNGLRCHSLNPFMNQVYFYGGGSAGRLVADLLAS